MLYNKYAREKRGRRQQKNEYIIWSNGQQQADKMKNLSMPAFTIEMFFFCRLKTSHGSGTVSQSDIVCTVQMYMCIIELAFNLSVPFR